MRVLMGEEKAATLSFWGPKWSATTTTPGQNVRLRNVRCVCMIPTSLRILDRDLLQVLYLFTLIYK